MSDVQAGKIVAEARAWIGTPYRHQGAMRGAGADCLGLIRGIWRELGGTTVDVPAYGADWRDLGAGTALEEGALRYLERVKGSGAAGDVVLFALLRHRPARHCGVMVATDRFVHATEHVGVVEVAFDENWRRRVAGVFRFPVVSVPRTVTPGEDPGTCMLEDYGGIQNSFQAPGILGPGSSPG